MRMSCNGCRVLRKGCSENCTIRPCLERITSPEAQSNATVFLAKFYGRAGLINLLNTGDQISRPAIFKSLLYEACGRIVNPINGATGLLSSGNWHLCQAAVDAVFSGASVAQLSPESARTMMTPPPFKAGDIRHVAKDDNVAPLARGVHKAKTRGQRKKAARKSKIQAEPADDDVNAALVMWSWSHEREEVRVPSSHGSGVSLGALTNWTGLGSDSAASVETVEASLAEPGEPVADGSGIQLELTLGIEPVAKKIKVGP